MLPTEAAALLPTIASHLSTKQMPMKLGKQVPVIRLQNGSSQWVSYSVVKEDKLLMTSVERCITDTSKASLSANTTDGVGAQAGVSRSATETRTLQGTSHLLVKDYRIPPSDKPGDSRHDVVGTTVDFPGAARSLESWHIFN